MEAGTALAARRLHMPCLPVSDRIFALCAQGLWIFSAGGGPEYLLARLVLRGGGRVYRLKWR